jgi:hypothetical protein
MNRRDAALHLAKRYPGGIDALRKELTGVNGYKWGVDDEELLVDLCQAARVPDALAPITAAAANAGALLIPLPQHVDADSTTWRCLASATEKFGALVRDIGDAVADGKVTANELRTVEADFGHLVSVGQHCLLSLKAMHEAAKPTHLRAAA